MKLAYAYILFSIKLYYKCFPVVKLLKNEIQIYFFVGLLLRPFTNNYD